LRKNRTLKPHIFRYLDEKGNTRFDFLINQINKETGVSKEKIKFRIEKLASEGELLIKYNIVSRIFSSKSSRDQTFDESLKSGPITIGRKDNVVTLEPEFGTGDINEIRRNAKQNLPFVKKDFEKGVKEIEELILKDYDPLDVLGFITTKNLLADPETYTESSFEGRQLLPETVQNIILKNDLGKYTGSNRKDIGKFHEMTQSLGSKLNSYILNMAFARDDLKLAGGEVYFHVINNFLWVRGDAYPQHYREISSELFSKIDDRLKKKGYSIGEYWATVDEINRQISYNFNEPIKKLHQEHAKFIEFSDNELKKGTTPTEIVRKYRQVARERIKALQSDLEKLSEIALKGCFEIEVKNGINQKLLELISMEFGENRPWNNPLDMSDIAIKPIIEANRKYYCFLTPHLTRNVIPIIESQLTQEDRDEIAYSDIKGDYFEAKAIQLLNEVIMGKAYSKLTYLKDNEIDGIIVLKDIIFLIEVKGKKKRVIAGTSDILKLTKDDYRAHVADAFDQTRRAYDYIHSKDEVELKDKHGTVVLRMRKDAIKKIYRIIVCLENFSKLAIDINLIKAWIPDLIKVDDYPWIVNIFDLIVISDLMEKNTAAFITYLNERLKVAESSTLEGVDEIDFLGYFFEYGNLDRLKKLKPANSTLITGFSEGIDRWYSYLRGEVSIAKKPVLKKKNPLVIPVS